MKPIRTGRLRRVTATIQIQGTKVQFLSPSCPDGHTMHSYICFLASLREISDMDVNKPILSLTRKPRQTVSETTQDTAVVVKRNRAQTKPEPNPAEPKKPRIPRSIPVSEACALFTPFWPALFDIENVRQDRIRYPGKYGSVALTTGRTSFENLLLLMRQSHPHSALGYRSS